MSDSVIKFKWRYEKRKMEDFLDVIRKIRFWSILETYALVGVHELKKATPVDSGKTASSWSYRITTNFLTQRHSIEWTNSNIENGVPIAIIIQTGHGTGTGGWVQGRDYINPTMAPILDKIAEMCWKEVNEA